jgi:acyl-CoA synthetase (AMP-forming)/AMP-acid ligase II
LSADLATIRLQATSLGDLLLIAADRQPDRMAVILPNERRSYADLRAAAFRRALSLQALGVQPGDHVGLLLPTGMDFIETLFAVALLGAVTVPINARYMPPELAYVVENADLKVLLTTDKIAEAVNFVERLNLAFPALAGADPQRLRLPDAPKLRNIVLYGTSTADGMLAEAEFAALAEGGDLERLHLDRLQVRLGNTSTPPAPRPTRKAA